MLARSDLFATDGSFDLLVIVLDFERAETSLADVQRFLWVALAAFAALKSSDKTHDFLVKRDRTVTHPMM